MTHPLAVGFRVDASPALGIGHFMRSLRLAAALRDAGAATWVLARELPPDLERMALAEGHAVRRLATGTKIETPVGEPWSAQAQRADADATVEALGDQCVDWLVADHYGLDARWERDVRRGCRALLVIDDLANRPHDTDLLLDQNFYRDGDTRYSTWLSGRETRLLGPRYALLDPSFRETRSRFTREFGPVRSLLVCFGGADERNHTGLALRAIEQLPRPLPAVTVVLGSSHPALAPIETWCGARGYRFEIQTQRMAERMAEADIAIGAGGSMTWERCALGLPTLALSVADNQRQVVVDAAAQGLLVAPDLPRGQAEASLTRHLQALSENSALRQLISRNGMAAVDGLGVARVVRAMGVSDVDVREATRADSRAIFTWRNAPDVRAVSHTVDEISWDAHSRWFDAALADSDRIVLVGHRGTSPVGVVRFDINNDAQAEVSIYLVPGVKARGTGSSLLHAAEGWLKTRRPGLACCVAVVREDNEPSHRLFRSAGYALETSRYTKVLTPS